MKNVQHVRYNWKLRLQHGMRLLSSCIIHKCGFVNSLRARSFPSEVNPTEREGSQTWILPQLKSPHSQTPLLTSHTFTQRGLHVKISGKGKGRQTHFWAVHWMANAHTRTHCTYPYKHLHMHTHPYGGKIHIQYEHTQMRAHTDAQTHTGSRAHLCAICSFLSAVGR